MKKILALLLAAMMIFTLAACGNNDDDSPTINNDDILTDEDLEDLDEALEILEALMPEGWDENRYGAYIYDVYDSDFLPDCFPKQIDGTLAYNTTFKDYDHDVLNGDYSVGYIMYESYEDYREYGVSFYVTEDQLNEFLVQIEAKGFKGEMEIDSDYWTEGFYAKSDWAMYLVLNPNDDKDGEYFGCLSVSATDDLFELPKSISGTTLPTFGIVTSDYNYYTIQDFSEGYEDVDFDLTKDTFPPEYYAAWFDYYGVSKQNAVDYVEELEANGWGFEYNYGEDTDLYRIVLKKENVYAYCNYENGYLMLGFSDMIENLTY